LKAVEKVLVFQVINFVFCADDFLSVASHFVALVSKYCGERDGGDEKSVVGE
jgi:hypothetical protein